MPPTRCEDRGVSDTTDPFDTYWATVDLAQPDSARARLEHLIADTATSPARVLFERASLHDALGEEGEAIPLYRAALDHGLDGPHRTEATIQLASSLRNVGDASGAIAALRDIPASDPLSDAADAFRALALFDDGKPAAALRTALHALAPHLPLYRRAVDAYADETATPDRVRSIVVGLLVHDGRVLLEHYPANDRHGGFLRAPGGGIEFGETAAAAIRREFQEELATPLDDARLLAVTENIFDSPTGRGHEIVHVFAVASAALAALPDGDRLAVLDADTTVGWYALDDLRDGPLPVFPDEIVDLALGLR